MNFSKYNLKLILFVTLSTISLTVGFYDNHWQAVDRKRFPDWVKSSDAFVVGRLLESRDHGILSSGGFLGLTGIDYWGSELARSFNVIQYQFDEYVYGNHKVELYWEYKSHPGGQGFLFGVLDQLLWISPGITLKLFRGISAVLAAIVLSSLFTWFYKEFGFMAALLSLLGAMFSEWPTLFGNSMYWAFWSFYLPMLGVLAVLSFSKSTAHMSHNHLGWLVYTTVLLKCLFSGFEFITTAVSMIIIPLVYYSIKDTWGLGTTLARFIIAGFASLGAIFTTIIMLMIQIMSIEGELDAGINYLRETLLKRTTDGLTNTSYIDIFSRYILEGRVIHFANQPGSLLHEFKWTLELSEIQLIIIFLIVTLLWLIVIRQTGVTNIRKAYLAGLLAV